MEYIEVRERAKQRKTAERRRNMAMRNIADHCERLNITRPKITTRYRTDLPSECAAVYDINTDTIYINTGKELPTEMEGYIMRYAVAHELRHKWQHIHHEDEYFANGNYKPRTEYGTDMQASREYNSQPAELDANAYGFLCLYVESGITLTGLPIDEDAVFERMEQIAEDFGVELDTFNFDEDDDDEWE